MQVCFLPACFPSAAAVSSGAPHTLMPDSLFPYSDGAPDVPVNAEEREGNKEVERQYESRFTKVRKRCGVSYATVQAWRAATPTEPLSG